MVVTVFKDKITYIVVDTPPPDIKEINENDSKELKDQKLVYNGYARDIFQRQNLSRGLDQTDNDDIIIISDLDEIPNLLDINFNRIKNQIVIQILLGVDQKHAEGKSFIHHNGYAMLNQKIIQIGDLI